MATNDALLNNSLMNEFLLNGEAFVEGESSTDDIVFNNFGLQNTKYKTRYVRHESPANRNEVLSPIPRSDGMTLHDAFLRQKTISMRGVLVADSNEDLLSEMDMMKKFLMQKNSTLKVTEGSTTRFYTGSLLQPERMFISRDHFNITWVDYDLVFACWTPFARSSETRNVSSLFTQTAGTINTSVFHAGNVGDNKGRAIYHLNFSEATSCTNVNIKNNTNNAEIDISRTFAAGEQLTVNGETGVVAVNGTEVDFDGFPPNLNNGSNLFTFTITSSSHTADLTIEYFDYYL